MSEKMSKKVKLTKKDAYLLILGVFLALLLQIAYDVAHEFANVLSHESIDLYWVGLQLALMVIDVLGLVVFLGRIEEE